MKQNEPTRIREGGTRVTRTTNGDEVIAALRQIVAARQYAKINGYMVDGFTAGGILTVYDKLDANHQEVMRNLPIHRMADVAMKLIKRHQEPA